MNFPTHVNDILEWFESNIPNTLQHKRLTVVQLERQIAKVVLKNSVVQKRHHERDDNRNRVHEKKSILGRQKQYLVAIKIVKCET